MNRSRKRRSTKAKRQAKRNPLVKAKYGSNLVDAGDTSFRLQPLSKREWIVLEDGVHMGSIKRLKAGWVRSPEWAKGAQLAAMNRAIALLDESAETSAPAPKVSADEWEARARRWFAYACAAFHLEPGEARTGALFPTAPPFVKDDPIAACRAIIEDGAPIFHARSRNPAVEIGSAADLERAQREYRKTHWGLSGEKKTRRLRTGNPEAGTLVALGDLVEIVYRTRKLGDAGQQEYEHKFAGTLPVLAYLDDRLLICGGSYRIEWRGIVG